VQSPDGPELRACKSVGSDGILQDSSGVFYPADLCRDLGVVSGRVLVPAATVELPEDGNIDDAQSGRVKVTPAAQPVWTAHFSTYVRTLRRLNWAALWQRGDGSATLLKNFAYALIVVVSLWTLFTVRGLGGSVTRLADNLVVVSGQLAKIQEEPAPLGRSPVDSLVPSPRPAVTPTPTPVKGVHLVPSPAPSVTPAPTHCAEGSPGCAGPDWGHNPSVEVPLP